MFEVGKYVVYGTTGICEIIQVAPLSFGQEGVYYTLRVVHDTQNNLIYAPVASVESGKVMLRDLISPETAQALLQRLPEEPLPWVPDLRKRSEYYTQLLSCGKAGEWARLLCCLYQKQREKQAEQKTLPRRDREILNLTEKLLFGELSEVLQLDMDTVKERFLALYNA